MASTFDLEQVNVPEIVESITGVIFAPIILPIAAAVKQPTVQAAIKEGIALSQRCREAVAEAGEVIENLTAEVNAELIEQREQVNSQLPQTDSQSSFHHEKNEKSEIAKDLISVLAEVNADVGKITNGFVDLRLLLPVGLSALAIRQLIIKGLQIDDIPWYTLGWYAFDSFVKLNDHE